MADLAPDLPLGIRPDDASSGELPSNRPKRRGPTAGQVLVVTSVMFTFISFWRTAAIVLCDLASTAYYIGGIVESQIGKAAPWFILAVMIFSYGVRSVYIESCAMFVRGGVYRIVKEAMGGGLAQAGGLGAAVRLHPDRPDQRRVGRPVHHRAAQRPVRPGPDSALMAHQNWALGGDRHRRDGLLLAGEHQGHPRVERPGPEDHGGDDGHGRRS